MLKRKINYKDFDGNQRADDFYFNLTEEELIVHDILIEGGWQAALQRIVEQEDRAGLITEFKRIILAAYGEKSDDGRRFVKSDELREAFSQTAAYNALFLELSTSDGKAADFIIGVFPESLTKEARKDVVQDKPTGPPPRPTPPLPPSR